MRKIFSINFIISLTVFIAGAATMIFELVGSRIISPYLGSSIYTWTSVIGVILGSLSAGYCFGGRLADKNPRAKNLSIILITASFFIAITAILKDLVPGIVSSLGVDLLIETIIVSLILFAPASIMLGMVSPYAIRINTKEIKTSGSSAGNIMLFSTLGSIIGTFLGGFVLIPFFGSLNTLLVIIALLFITSFLINPIKLKPINLFLILAVILLATGSYRLDRFLYEHSGIIDIDTPYNKILVFESKDEESGRAVLNLATDPFGTQSAMFIDSDELVFEYTKYLHLIGHFNPSFNRTLMIGGGAYSFPRDYLDRYPEASIDVVEIDPGMTETARKYFRLEDDERLKIYHEDGRSYLNNSPEKYDVIIIDAFNSLSVPFQLATREAVVKEYELLNQDGIILINTISSIEGEKGKFFRAEYATYKNVFPQVYAFPVRDSSDGEKVQNIILVALKSRYPVEFLSSDSEIDNYLRNVWRDEIANDAPILTDDLAPVEYYQDLKIR